MLQIPVEEGKGDAIIVIERSFQHLYINEMMEHFSYKEQSRHMHNEAYNTAWLKLDSNMFG